MKPKRENIRNRFLQPNATAKGITKNAVETRETAIAEPLILSALPLSLRLNISDTRDDTGIKCIPLPIPTIIKHNRNWR